MRKLLVISAATAAFMLAGAANAAMYIVTDASGQQFVVSDNNVRTPLLMGTVDVAPDNCQAGFYYQAGNNRIMPCSGGPAFVAAPATPGTMMADGQPFPTGTLMMQNAGAVNDTGTTKRGDDDTANNPAATGSIDPSADPQSDGGANNN